MRSIFLFLIQFYKIFLSPFLGGNCRFYPSCSNYGEEAFKKHGSIKGFILTTKRLLKCHPLGSDGYDPVPNNSNSIKIKGKINV